MTGTGPEAYRANGGSSVNNPAPDSKQGLAGAVHAPVSNALSIRDQAIARLRLIWEARRLLGRCVVAGILLFAPLAFAIPTQYQSTTRLMPPEQADPATALLMGAAGANATAGLGAIAGDLLSLKSSGALFIGVLESRRVQDAVVDKFALREAYGVSRITDAREALAQKTDIIEDRRGGMITIQVLDHDPRRAAAIAQAYVDELNQVVTELNTGAAHRERVFLEQRLAQVKQDLESAERDFSEFSSRNAAIDIQAQGKAVIDAAAMLEGQSIAAQSELQSLRQVYTDANVRVRQAQARVDELNRQLEKMGGPADPPQVGTGVAARPESGALREASMVPSIRKLPLLGVSYADLYRRTKIQEALFQALTQEYEFAKVEEAKETPSVKVIDPPDIPEEKFSPHRLWIIAAGAFFSFAAGLAWVFGSASWQTLDAGDPARILGLEVLAAAEARTRGIAAGRMRARVESVCNVWRQRAHAGFAKRGPSRPGAASDS